MENEDVVLQKEKQPMPLWALITLCASLVILGLTSAILSLVFKDSLKVWGYIIAIVGSLIFLVGLGFGSTALEKANIKKKLTVRQRTIVGIMSAISVFC